MKAVYICIVMAFALPVAAFGWGQREAVEEEEQVVVEDTAIEVGDIIEMTGRLRVVGNDPFTQLVLTLEQSDAKVGRSRSFAIMDAYHDILWEKQQQTVTLLVEVVALPKTGMPGAVEVQEILERD